jgi:hypothetical protein
VFSLTLVRMLPVWLCLAGTGVPPRDLILDARLDGSDTLGATIVCTVLPA